MQCSGMPIQKRLLLGGIPACELVHPAAIVLLHCFPLEFRGLAALECQCLRVRPSQTVSSQLCEGLLESKARSNPEATPSISIRAGEALLFLPNPPLRSTNWRASFSTWRILRRQSAPFPRRSPGVEPTIRQVNETFVPQMLAIQTGETVRFPNDDPFFHNVFSLSGARSFDLGRYPKNQVRSVKFDRPGIVKIFCHIHSHMNAVIRVFDHPYFCRAGSDGTFSIAQVPEGTYTIVAWHERLKPQRQVIRVQPGENVSIDFVL